MLWLALHCPTLALDCLLRRWPDGIEPAMAVSDVDGTRRFIAAATRSAQACGVFAGQSVATALALLPDLLVVARRIDDERRALTDAALAALRFTPTVSLRPSGLVLEISASVRLFGGRPALKKRIAATIRGQGLAIAAAEAPTPHGAWLLAKENARRRLEAMQDALRQPRPSTNASASDRWIDARGESIDARGGPIRTHGGSIDGRDGSTGTREMDRSTKEADRSTNDESDSIEAREMDRPVSAVDWSTKEADRSTNEMDRSMREMDRPVRAVDRSPADEGRSTREPHPSPRRPVATSRPPARDDDGMVVEAPGSNATPASGLRRDDGPRPPATSWAHAEDDDRIAPASTTSSPAATAIAPASTASGPAAPTRAPASTTIAASCKPSASSTLPASSTGEPSSHDRVVRDPASASPRDAAFDAALDALPIAHLESLGPSARRMRGIGLFTLADLRRLPPKGLARRFGPGLVDELARAAGDRPDPQVVFEAPSRFDARVELMARVESAEALVFASQRLLAQLGGWLTARRAAVRRFTLILHHDRWTRDAIEPTPVDIALATPSSDPARLLTLVRERLTRLELKAPVLELALEAPVIVEEQETHHTLFPERDDAVETLARLLEKLTARLGPDAMARIERVADHRPERAWREVSGDLLDASSASIGTRSARPAARTSRGPSNPRTKPSRTGATAAPERDADPDVGVSHRPITPGCSSGPRPAWLLSEPQQLEVRVDRPLYESLPLDLVAGPERIESGWWDDATVTRDYFIAENAAGHLVWVYRERLIAPDERPAWYLQGLFA